MRKKRTSRKKSRRTSRRAVRRNVGTRKSVVYSVKLGVPAHLEQILFTDAQGRGAVLKRFMKPVVWFKPTASQTKKIIAGKGTISIMEGQITDRAQWLGRNPRRRKRKSRSRR